MSWQVWRWPVLLAVLTSVGLIAGLVSDGAGDWLAWLALGLPVAIGAWFGLRRGAPKG